MVARQRIVPIRRDYNRWVADQTLEDYALRFTAKSARRFSSQRIAQTAIGAISFLALEAIGGTITLSYGTTNAIAAIAVACVIMLIVSLPVSRYAIRYGVDIDLLTRGASFGYIGSTVTSLIYASFTFLLFAIEASIMSGALELVFGIPLWIGYIVSAVAVIPLVTYGVRMISRFQVVTQPFWIVLNIAPFIVIALTDWQKFDLWRAFSGLHAQGLAEGGRAPFVLAQFGAASAVILALTAQIGEQVDFLRFLPPEGQRRLRHRIAVFLAGPGWVLLGGPKLLAGSFLTVLALSSAVPVDRAADPAHMYLIAFNYMIPWPQGALLLTVAFVVVSQLKINVMNAYAGSLAWSNFFSRLTHSHPGRVVWLVFNVAIALLLMELGIYRLLEGTLGIFSLIAMAWLCAVSADLSINKPLGLSPPGIEFKRAHLYDINPVGLGTLVISGGLSLFAHFGAFGGTAQALAPFIALVSAFVASPLIAWLTKGRYYLARKPRRSWRLKPSLTCSICEHPFEPEDMAWCPAYAAPICSLCCSLDGRCRDLCKPKANTAAQLAFTARRVLPERAVAALGTRLGRYGLAVTVSLTVLAAILAMAGYQSHDSPEVAAAVGRSLFIVFFILAIISTIVCWFYVLAQDSRAVAEEETSRQNALLLKEIAAHRKTDAALQKAMEAAQSADRAKSRYVVSLSHELRTPLNVVLGYAQLLERDDALPVKRQPAIHAIKRNADHLSGLIDGLLDISRIEAGRFQVYSDEINFSDFLDQIVDMMQPQAGAKRLELKHTRSDNMPGFVRADEKRLRQILLNLLSNAVKFTERGHVSFDVSYRNQIAVFTISDSGRGIAEDDLKRIFEPFQRGEAEKLSLPGLGLGLTITRLLTETLGGEISVESTYGEGSTFRVRMMLSSVAHPSMSPTQTRIIGYEGARRTVMAVDDNEDHRNLVRELLEPLGFTVVSAASGLECLDMREEAGADLFLIDISMPGMNGWQLVSRLREVGVKQPIVMLSANIGNFPAAEEFDGHNDVLVKPFDVRQLLTKMKRLMGLEWLREKEPAPVGTRPDGEAIESPGGNHLRDLIRLGEIGYIRGIESKLNEIEETDGNQAFVSELRRYVKKFDMAGYDRFLRELEADGQEERQ